MDFDEVSTVDKPANQYSRIVLAKRFQEDGMTEPGNEYEAPEAVFDGEGEQVDPATLEAGELVQDEEGYLWYSDGERLVPAYEDDFEPAEEPELEQVGKSAFLDNAGAPPSATQKVLESLSVELSKALDDEQRTAVVSKAVRGL